jgi:ribA/ribD-fused uncharacterized protein
MRPHFVMAGRGRGRRSGPAVESDTYVVFYESDSPFSNFFPVSPPPGEYPAFRSSEQYFMYQKAVQFGDDAMAQRILAARTPGQAKQLGRQVRNFDDVVWTAKRYDVMVEALRYKVRVCPEFREALRATQGKRLVEGSPSDRIWGVGIAKDDPAILDEANWRGQNLLGRALMQVRDEIFPEAAGTPSLWE